MIPHRAAAVILLSVAAAAGQTASRPAWASAGIPPDLAPAAIASRMAGMVFGSIADRQLTTDAPGGSIEVRVIAPLVGAALAPWAGRYAAVLPALRVHPHQHWFALGLLGDETVVDVMGRWLEETLVDPATLGMSEPLTALRLIGGKRSLDRLYAAAPKALAGASQHAAQAVMSAIAELESPDQWKRVAALQRPGARFSDFALVAAVQVLAKKP